MRSNFVKHRLAAGGTAFGTLVNEFATPGIARLLAAAGADYALFDMEHTGFGFDTIRALVSYSRGADPSAGSGQAPSAGSGQGLVPFVRVPASEQHFVSRCLDVGALGVMLPMIESAQQIRDFVNWAKFAPEGARGQAWGAAHDDYLPGSNADKMRQANQETMLLGLIESAPGLENLEAILEVGGLDVAWVGHNDLSSALGIPGQFDHPRYLEAIDRVLSLCQRYGCTPAATSASAEGAVALLRRGFRCVAYGTDVGLLQRALTDGMQQLRTAAGSRERRAP